MPLFSLIIDISLQRAPISARRIAQRRLSAVFLRFDIPPAAMSPAGAAARLSHFHAYRHYSPLIHSFQRLPTRC